MDDVRLLIVCTGNAARSVMAGSMLERLAATRGAPLVVATAGTHAVDGQPMGARTRAAMTTIAALDGLAAGAHRSRQVGDGDVEHADLVVAMEADHVRFVRRRHPAAAARTATIRRLVRELPPGSSPLHDLEDRVASLRLADATLGDDEDVADPAGKEDDAYAACAGELWILCQALMARL